MKKILFLLLAIAIMQSSYAQLLKFGLRAGINSSTIKVDDIVEMADGDYQLAQSDAKIGFHFGAVLQSELGPLFIQPEILFMSTGGTVEVKNVVSGDVNLREQTFSRIDIPIMLGYKLLDVVKIEAGPVASYVLSSKSELFDFENYEEKFNKATWGAQVGIGADLFDKVGLDVKYEFGLSRLGNGLTVAGEKREFDLRSNQLVISVAYYF